MQSSIHSVEQPADTQSPDQAPLLVVVLGMHRSGTSAITKILLEAGFFVGEESDMIKGDQWNRDGYLERWSVYNVNNIILFLCGGTWCYPPKESDILRMRIDPKIETLMKVYGGHRRAVIKDPRLCLTLPVWQRVLGDTVRIVRVTRQPEAVAASLMKRDGFSQRESFALWKIYNERASRYARSYPVFSMKYEDLFSDNRPDLLNELSRFLNIQTDLEQIAAQVVDPALQHHGRDDLGKNKGSKCEE